MAKKQHQPAKADELDEQIEPITEQNEAQPEVELSLEDRAKAVLAYNDRGGWTIPAEGLYPHQWLWDSCFISIGIRHYDVERAKLEILNLLRGQWSNGMVPHMIMDPVKKDARDGKIWRSWLNPNAPDDVSTSGITQPPLIAEAVVRIGEKLKLTERRSWYKTVFHALLAYHQWLYAERDPHGEGLILLISPWESGLDNTPPWMHELYTHLLPWWIRALRSLHLDSIFGMLRSDRKFAAVDQRLTNVEALALYDVQRRLRRKNYETDRILDHSLFTIEDLAFNSIFIRANQHLRSVAKTLREDLPEDLVEHMHKTEQALADLWDTYASEYFSRDFITHDLIKISSVAAFLPLYAGTISQEHAKVIVRMLENKHLFGPAFPVPSAPLNSPYFQPKRYWQGPSWVNMNWLIIDGLERYGFTDHAKALRETTLEMVDRNGMHEYFDPVSGEPAGTDNFSWTAALTIDLLHKKL